MQFNFIANGDRISLSRKDNTAYTGNVNSYDCLFEFSQDWNNLHKFMSIMVNDVALDPIEIVDNKCVLPALNQGEIKIGIYGTNLSNTDLKRISSNWLSIYVDDGAYKTDTTTPKPYTPDLWEQYLAQVLAVKDETVSAKDEATKQATISTEQAVISTTKANISTEQANNASLNKDATDVNVSVTEQNKQATEQAKTQALTAQGQAEYWAKYSEKYALNQPTHYYKNTVEEMNAIIAPKQGDICYIIKSTEKTEQYVYDTTDMDGDNVNPEWLFIGYLTDIKEITWKDVTGKPNFHKVATSGNYADLLNKPSRNESFITINNGIWDFVLTDKIILTVDLVRIDNVTNGAIGLINTTLDLTLPTNSKKAYDYDYMNIVDTEHYLYTFLYDGSYFHWTRTVCS